MSRIRALTLLLATASATVPAGVPARAQASAERPVLEMRPCRKPMSQREMRCGTYHAPENRDVPGGRTIPLDVVVVPARGPNPRPDPVFYFVGGPGQTATESAVGADEWPMGEYHDLVLVDQRGTSPSHALDCRLPGSAGNPQGYLAPIFQRDVFRACRRELEQRADLTRYLTADYVEDLEEIRRALRYGRINIQGGSYGTRVVLFYIRQYPESIRAAYATGLYPTSARNPLQHARDSQAALDSVFALCARDAACSGAFPGLRAEFAAVMQRLRAEPVRVTIQAPGSDAPAEVTLDADAFAEALRVTLYSWERARRVPLLLHRAHEGDFRPFAQLGINSNAGLRNVLRWGLLLSTICSEDVPRIGEDDIVRETAGTFIGDVRVRTQRAVCQEWPRRALPPGYTDPVVSDVPTLLISGAYDPAMGPRWGDDVVRTLRNGAHVVVPGGHTPWDPCIEQMVQQFFARASVQGLDTSCVARMERAPFILREEPPSTGG